MSQRARQYQDPRSSVGGGRVEDPLEQQRSYQGTAIRSTPPSMRSLDHFSHLLAHSHKPITTFDTVHTQRRRQEGESEGYHTSSPLLTSQKTVLSITMISHTRQATLVRSVALNRHPIADESSHETQPDRCLDPTNSSRMKLISLLSAILIDHHPLILHTAI